MRWDVTKLSNVLQYQVSKCLDKFLVWVKIYQLLVKTGRLFYTFGRFLQIRQHYTQTFWSPWAAVRFEPSDIQSIPVSKQPHYLVDCQNRTYLFNSFLSIIFIQTRQYQMTPFRRVSICSGIKVSERERVNTSECDWEREIAHSGNN